MSLYKRFEPIGKYWLGELEKYNDGPFLRRPKPGYWSIGEVYSHLFDVTFHQHVVAIEEALGNKNAASKGKTFLGFWSFFRKKFLIPFPKKNRLKNKEPKTMTIAESKDMMIRLLKKMKHLSDEIEKCSKDELKQKVQHPYLGGLSVKEWYWQIIFHFQRHLKQKQMIDQHLMKH